MQVLRQYLTVPTTSSSCGTIGWMKIAGVFDFWPIPVMLGIRQLIGPLAFARAKVEIGRRFIEMGKLDILLLFFIRTMVVFGTWQQ